MYRKLTNSTGDESIGRYPADALSQLSRLNQQHHHRLDVSVATAGLGGGGERSSQRRKQEWNDEGTFKREIRDFFLPESDCTARVQRGDRESHRVRTYIRIAIYSGLCDEAEATKLCHAEAFPGLHRHLSEIVDGEEELY